MLIKGNNHSDERGLMSFVNDFNLQGVKRFYAITHPNISVTRAWQGHKVETKYFFAAKGSFLVGWVKPGSWGASAEADIVNRQTLEASSPAVLKVMPGYANGFRALEPGSILLVFSDLALDESASDTYRFEANTWTL